MRFLNAALTCIVLAMLLACGGVGTPVADQAIVDSLSPASESSISAVNDGTTDGCKLTADRTWEYRDESGLYIVGALNGPGVEDVLAVWFMPGESVLVWADVDAKTFSEWGSSLPATSADRVLAGKIEDAAEVLIRQ